MDIVYVIGLLLFFVHVVAFVAGGANSVVMPIIGAKMATASPELRAMRSSSRACAVPMWQSIGQ